MISVKEFNREKVIKYIEKADKITDNSKKNNIMCSFICPHLVCKTEWGLYFLLSYSYPNHELRAITECL